jgi:hypothetical protein
MGRKGHWADQYVPTISSRVALKLFTTTHTLTHFLTGHGNFRQYLHRFKKARNPHCDCDLDAVYTPYHRIFNCPLFEAQRYNLLREIQQNTEIANLEPYSFISKPSNLSFIRFIGELRLTPNMDT